MSFLQYLGEIQTSVTFAVLPVDPRLCLVRFFLYAERNFTLL